MPRTRSKRVGKRRSRHIRHRGRRSRASRRIRRRRRVSHRQMRGGNLFSQSKQLRKIPPGKHQKEDDDWSLGIFGDSKNKTEGDTKKTKPQITYTANKPDSNKPDSNKPDSNKPRRGTKNLKAPDAKNLPDPTKLFGYLEEEKKAKMEELAEMKAKQRNKKRQITFDESIKQDKKEHDNTDKKLNKQLSGLHKMVGQTSTSQSSTNGMTCVEPIPNIPGSFKVLDQDGIQKHLI